ncbi:alcohol dehydrogenase [Capronia epimyces CBS 606.96]|uniref:Alcohol dehydrogenase n=1 Tax=Capronia epimyces CBS 606.96 TaxID=1182542 RepID=W9YSF7_9EURO|nr:alcohol dehydrogenase [Capronia epimyces CBS 606.96]EXJ85219.1 alcohol dehydrogenase [Capronia epimyces CBS 606.96]
MAPPKPIDIGPIINFVPTIRHDTYPAIDPLQANLSGKYVLITGASKGIGRATALSFAKAGASGIAVLARSDLSSLVSEIYAAAEKAGRQRPHVLPLTADQTNEAQVQAAADKIATEFGRLDILINNAGYLEAWKPIAESDANEWWKTFEVNVKGVYLLDRALIPLLLKTENGEKTIIVVTSMGALTVAPGASAYQTTKQTVLRLNNFLVAEYGDQGLLAYAAHPGGVLTELAKGMPEYMYDLLNDTPELAADMFVWLTRERREWLNDRFLRVNWDVDELLTKKDQVLENDLLRYQMRT